MASLAACPWTFRPLEEGATVSPYNNRELLPNWTESVTHCVAMAGARNSGKSLYTAVMVKQLKQLAHKHNHSVFAADQSTEQRFQEKYEQPLFQEMKSMDPTPSAVATDAYQRDPLIFDLGQWPDPEGTMRTNYLVFRDVAGEDLENLPEREDDREALSFFKYADLVIFLFDRSASERSVTTCTVWFLTSASWVRNQPACWRTSSPSWARTPHHRWR